MSDFKGRSSTSVLGQTHQTPETNVPHRISSGHKQAAERRVKGSTVNAVWHYFGYPIFSYRHLLKSRAVARWISAAEQKAVSTLTG